MQMRECVKMETSTSSSILIEILCAVVTGQGLSHHGKDNFLAALMRIPYGLRTMYVHAYQSYLWNTATSERCLKYGTDSVVEGDLVLLSGEAQESSLQDNGRRSVCVSVSHAANHMQGND